MRRLSHRLAVSALAGALSAVPLAAQIRVGQSFTVPAAPLTLLQQVTAGLPGLEGVGGTAADPFVADIFALSGGALTGPSLFSQVLGPSFGGVTLTPNLALTAGATYAVVVTRPNAIGSTIPTIVSTSVGSPADFYSAGQAIICAGAAPCIAGLGSGTDIAGFSVQFGPAVSAVPEPGTWALLASGLLGLAGGARRRRRAR